jgi:hypothetical protein
MLQMLLGASAAADKTYIENMFSLQVWPGTSHTVNPRSVVNNLDLSTDGGLVWIKERGGGQSHVLFDTIRGVTKALECAGSAAEETQTDGVTAFNTNGFTVGGGGKVNDTGKNYANWSWKKTPGFFDVVSWTGNGSARTISHSLGCIPGMIIVKQYGSNTDYVVYHTDMHKDTPEEYFSYFNETNAATNSPSSLWNDTAPTASVFSIGTDALVNASSGSYVAYVFAGGESTAATARSVYFTGGNNINTNTDNDFSFGTGDYCIECWCKFDDHNSKYTAWTLGDTNTAGGMSFTAAYSTFRVNDGRTGDIILTKDTKTAGQWAHIAVTRASGTSRFFINGKLVDTSTDQSGDSIGSGSNNKMTIGTQIENGSAGDHMKGNISNFRVVKGSAVYTTDFKVPTEPLTNITNTVLLCCNNASITGSTVTPTTINDSGGTASTDSPFDDPAAFIFGEGGDQNVIKCGSFSGTGSADLEVKIGFEPQWLLLKNTSASESWHIFDSLRGIVTGNVDAMFTADNNNAEANTNRVDLTSTGFIMTDGNSDLNGSGNTIIYMAIRRPDGYVGQPPALGTDVFAMDTGNSSSTIPCFDSTFPVDFGLMREPAASSSWLTGARLTGDERMFTDSTAADASDSNLVFDSNVGYFKDLNSDRQAWMWKRHAGFDVVTYDGNGTAGHEIAHSLNKTPEMIWVKNRDRSEPWRVYHIGLNGGTTPHNYGLKLNTNDEESAVTIWNQTAPTSTYFTINADSGVNHNNEAIVALLFASVAKISKCGYYTGNGTSDSSTQTITTGFQPRFVLIKSSSNDEHWVTFDTTRGWSSGSSDQLLELNETGAQTTALGDLGHPISTGFVIKEDESVMNLNNHKYIYYAHA